MLLVALPNDAIGTDTDIPACRYRGLLSGDKADIARIAQNRRD